jgi:putative heme-binding domain-containing protein
LPEGKFITLGAAPAPLQSAQRLQLCAFALIAISTVSFGQAGDQKPKPSAGGQRTFESTCAPCHGLNGKGGERAPDVVTRREVVRLSDIETLKILKQGVVSKGMPPFASLGPARLTELLNYLRSLQGKGQNRVSTADVQKGKQLFAGKARCAECHMVRGAGGFIGPDLSDYGALHSANDIRDAIVDADKRPGFRKHLANAVTRDGRQISGVVRNEDNFSLQLQSLDGGFHLLNKAELSEFNLDSKTLMPADYVSSLNKQELDQIVGYLLSVGNAKP